MNQIADEVLRRIYNSQTDAAVNNAVDRYIPAEYRPLVRREALQIRRRYLSYKQFKESVKVVHGAWDKANRNVEKKLRGYRDPETGEKEAPTMEPPTKVSRTEGNQEGRAYGEEVIGGNSGMGNFIIPIAPTSKRQVKRLIYKGQMDFTGWSNKRTEGSFGPDVGNMYASYARARFATMGTMNDIDYRGSNKGGAFDSFRPMECKVTMLPYAKSQAVSNGSTASLAVEGYLEQCKDYDQVKSGITVANALTTGFQPANYPDSGGQYIEENSSYSIQTIGDNFLTREFPLSLQNDLDDMTNVTQITRHKPGILCDLSQIDNYVTGCLIDRLILNNNSIGKDLTSSTTVVSWPIMMQWVIVLEQAF